MVVEPPVQMKQAWLCAPGDGFGLVNERQTDLSPKVQLVGSPAWQLQRSAPVKVATHASALVGVLQMFRLPLAPVVVEM